MGEERREEKREDLGNYRLVSQWYTHKEISEKKKKSYIAKHKHKICNIALL